MASKRKLTVFELDAIREMAAVGAGHSSTALSELAKKQVIVSFPSVSFYKIEEIPSLIGKPYELVTTVILRIEGKHQAKRFPVGEMLLIFVEKSALDFTNLLWNRENKKLDESDLDALKETGNILSGACLSALTEYLDFKMVESMPGAATDMLGSTMDSTLANLAVKTDEALVFMTDFKISGHDIKSYFLILFDPTVLEVLVKKIKEKSQ